MMKENSKNVFKYVAAHGNEEMTADSIGAALELGSRSVVGIVNAFVKKGLMYRTEGEIETADGKHKAVKYIHLTEEGAAFDPDADSDKE